MQKWTMFALFSIACLLAAGLMLFNMPKAPVEETAPEGVTLLTIEANDDFTFGAAEYKVKVGEPVLIKLKNESSIQHGAEIKELGINLHDGEMKKEVTFDKPGKYEIHCSVMCGAGHLEMKSYLVVE